MNGNANLEWEGDLLLSGMVTDHEFGEALCLGQLLRPRFRIGLSWNVHTVTVTFTRYGETPGWERRHRWSRQRTAFGSCF